MGHTFPSSSKTSAFSGPFRLRFETSKCHIDWFSRRKHVESQERAARRLRGDECSKLQLTHDFDRWFSLRILCMTKCSGWSERTGGMAHGIAFWELVYLDSFWFGMSYVPIVMNPTTFISSFMTGSCQQRSTIPIKRTRMKITDQPSQQSALVKVHMGFHVCYTSTRSHGR